MSDTAVVIPFGKYKGKPIEEVASQDPQYLAWLQTQDWFLDKFEYLIRYLTDTPGTGAPAPEETPAHNAMQVKFLDPDYRLAVAAALGLEAAMRNTLRKRIPKRLQQTYRPVLAETKLGRIYAPTFERKCDVDFVSRMSVVVKEKGEKDCEYAALHCVYVELKPAIGDDYPAVLRQMARQEAASLREHELRIGRRISNDWLEIHSWKSERHWVLLIDNFTGSGATLDQMSEMFANVGITVLTTGDVDLFAYRPNPSTKGES